MDRKLFFSQQKGFVHVVAVLISLGLLVALAFSLNALFASRIQETPPTTEQPEAEGQPTAVTAKKPQRSYASSLDPVPTIDLSQSNPTSDWKVYNSPLGYSIKYPPTWFAASHPSAANADVLYDRKDYFQVLSGKMFDHGRSFDTDFFVVVQELSFGNLNVPLTENVEELVESIDRFAEDDRTYFSVLQEEPFQMSGTHGLLRKVEEGTQDKIEIVLIHKGKIYMLYTYLSGPQVSYREGLFEEIASTLQFTK